MIVRAAPSIVLNFPKQVSLDLGVQEVKDVTVADSIVFNFLNFFNSFNFPQVTC